jgi:beta-galactosidase
MVAERPGTSRPDTATVYELLLDALGRAGVRPMLDGKNPDIEVVERAGTRWVLNFGRDEAVVTLGDDTVTIPAHDLARLPVS